MKERMNVMLRPWSVPIQIEANGGQPLYQQIASSVIADIQRGRLKPGTALPGTRVLSKRLGLNRNTVATAYEELIAQGWATAESSRGTFVMHRQPRIVHGGMPSVSLAGLNDEPGRRKVRQTTERGALPRFNFADEEPDSRIDSGSDFNEAFRRAICGQFNSSSTSCDPRGTYDLREGIAEMLRTRRGVLAGTESVLITRSRQMGLYLCAQASLKPGSVVVVEQPGQKRVWDTFRMMGARVIGVPVDDDGLQVDTLRQLSKVHVIRAVYVTPAHHYPTTVTMSAQRRKELLQWAEETGTLIFEDDLDHDYEYDVPSQLALASEDRNDSVVYIGSFSKLIMPGPDFGFIATTGKRARRMAQMRALIDRQGESAMELTVAQLMRSGKLQRRAAKTVNTYRERRDVLTSLLQKHFGELVRVVIPNGGSAVWIDPRPAVSIQEWVVAASKIGVKVCCSSNYSLDGSSTGGMRLSFASMCAEEMEQAVSLLADCYPVHAQLSTAS